MAWGNFTPKKNRFKEPESGGLEESSNSTNERINGNTECDAMSIAVKLNEEEYSLAKKEIEECSALLWRQAKESFHLAAARNAKVKSRGMPLEGRL